MKDVKLIRMRPVVLLLLVSIVLVTFTCPTVGIQTKVKTETAVTQFADSVKPFIFEGSDSVSKISLLLFVILFLPALHVSGKKVSRKLLFTVTERNSFYSCVTINAP